MKIIFYQDDLIELVKNKVATFPTNSKGHFVIFVSGSRVITAEFIEDTESTIEEVKERR